MDEDGGVLELLAFPGVKWIVFERLQQERSLGGLRNACLNRMFTSEILS